MTDILEQSEVDALLAAVADQDIEEGRGAAGHRPRANQEVSLYDFRRPESVSKDQMRALQAIHEAFARNFGASLSGFLRTMVEVRVATTEQLTYSEFVQSLPSPTCFNLLSASQLSGQLCLEISPLIVFPIVDRLLGGTNADIFIPQRPLTSIETRLTDRILNRALKNLTEAWHDLIEVNFELAATESNPNLVQIVAPNEVVVVIGFEIKVGARAGTMSLCIPFNVIEPVIGKLGAQSWLAYSRSPASTAQQRWVAKNIERAHVGVRVYLGEAGMSVKELVSLAPGDLIKLDKLVSQDFVLRVEGRNKFAGRLGQVRGNRALQITRGAEREEGL